MAQATRLRKMLSRWEIFSLRGEMGAGGVSKDRCSPGAPPPALPPTYLCSCMARCVPSPQLKRYLRGRDVRAGLDGAPRPQPPSGASPRPHTHRLNSEKT